MLDRRAAYGMHRPADSLAEAVSGADLVLIVTEPTVSGVHDMNRVLELAGHFGVPAAVILNKADLHAEQAACIEETAERHGARVVARIPFDEEVTGALMAGRTVVEAGDGPAARAIRDAWSDVLAILERDAAPAGKRT